MEELVHDGTNSPSDDDKKAVALAIGVVGKESIRLYGPCMNIASAIVPPKKLPKLYQNYRSSRLLNSRKTQARGN